MPNSSRESATERRSVRVKPDCMKLSWQMEKPASRACSRRLAISSGLLPASRIPSFTRLSWVDVRCWVLGVGRSALGSDASDLSDLSDRSMHDGLMLHYVLMRHRAAICL